MAPPNLSTEMDPERVRDIVKYFLSRYRFLYEKRIQKLVFYSDVFCLINFGGRLTHVDFKPYIYGAYSDDLSNILEWMDDEKTVPTKTDVIRGKSVTQYQGIPESECDLDENIEAVLDYVHDQTKRKSTDDLANFSKQSWLYENTPYGEPMDFSEFLSELENDEPLEKRYRELIHQFPDGDLDEADLVDVLVEVPAPSAEA